jgi:hypothetical protein
MDKPRIFLGSSGKQEKLLQADVAHSSHNASDQRSASRGMGPPIARLLRPYRTWLAVILIATAVETAMSLAAPWPLKIVLDNVIEGRPAPGWLAIAARWLPGDGVIRLAAVAAIATVLIAAIGALASYFDNYFTESVGQWVANDLRVRVYHHLEHLSLAYYDTHPTGALLSTISAVTLELPGSPPASTHRRRAAGGCPREHLWETRRFSAVLTRCDTRTRLTQREFVIASGHHSRSRTNHVSA